MRQVLAFTLLIFLAVLEGVVEGEPSADDLSGTLFVPGDIEPCPQQHNPPDGTITSPNHPRMYDNDIYCDIILQLHNPQRIWKEVFLRVDAFDTEWKKDILIVNGQEYSGNGSEGGNAEALRVGFTYKFRSNFVWFHMRFISDRSGQRSGFSLDYRITDSEHAHNISEVCDAYWRKPCGRNGICHSHVEGYYCVCKRGWQGNTCNTRIIPGRNCPQNFTSPTGLVVSENYPNYYPNRILCDMDIHLQTTPGTWWEIVILVNEFVTERCCDRLTVSTRMYRGNGTNARDPSALIKGQTYLFRSPLTTFRMHFRTDGSVVRKGYSLQYTVRSAASQTDTALESCASSPCKNGATCHSLLAGPKCLCRRGFFGQFCEARGDTRGCPLRYRTTQTTIQSVNYPRPYPSNMQCDYHFDLTICRNCMWKQLRFYMWYFETQRSRDIVYLWRNGTREAYSGWGYSDTSAPRNRAWYYLYTQEDQFNMTFLTQFVSLRNRHPGFAFNFYLYPSRGPRVNEIADTLYLDESDYSTPEFVTSIITQDGEEDDIIDSDHIQVETGIQHIEMPGRNLYFDMQANRCPMYKYPPRGSFSSPNFPNNYDNTGFCDIIIYTRNTNQNVWKDIRLIIRDFDTQQKADYLIVNGREYSGNGSDIAKNPNALQVGRSYLFRNNYQWFHMRFMTDGRDTRKGFNIQFEVSNSRDNHSISEICTVNNPCGRNGECHSHVEGFYCACKPGWTGNVCNSRIIIRPSCPKSYDPPTGVIQSENYPNKYPNRMRCTMNLNLNNARRMWKDISIKVEAFKTESCCDRLTINGRQYAGDGNTTSRRNGAYAMQEGWTYLFRSNQPVFVMSFNTDGSVVYKGFSLQYSIVDSPTQRGPTESCINNPCQNNGVCHSRKTGPFCMCRGQWSGPNCDRKDETFGCPQYIFTPRGAIQSPNWPRPYPRTGVDCSYYIRASPMSTTNQVMDLFVDYFETSRGRHILTVTDAMSRRPRQFSGIGYYDTAALKTQQSYRFTTTNGWFNMTFKTRSRGRYLHTGFLLHYTVSPIVPSTTPPPTTTRRTTTTPTTTMRTTSPTTATTATTVTTTRTRPPPRTTKPMRSQTPPNTFASQSFTPWWRTTMAQRQTKPPVKKPGTISAGSIVGIVIAVLVVVGILLMLGLKIFRRRDYLSSGLKNAMKPGIENAVYGHNDEKVSISAGGLGTSA